jgi:outer membrane beta-barrel protein
METGLRVLLLTLAGLILGGCASVRGWLDRDAPPAEQAEPTDEELARAEQTEAEEGAPRVIDPEVERRKIKVPRIDTENIELGGFFGALSIEDFGTNPVYGITGAYHITEDFFAVAEVGRSQAGRTSFETLGGNIQLLTDDERQLTYYNLGLGYNFLPGEVFLGRGRAMTSALYVTMGVGNTEFAGDDHVTVNLGAGYRVLPTDWLALHVGLQAHLFNSDLLGSDKMTSNLQAHMGVTVFF